MPYNLWQQAIFILVHITTLWLLLTFFVTVAALLYLAAILDKHNARQREAAIARKAAIAYTVTGTTIWLIAITMS